MECLKCLPFLYLNGLSKLVQTAGGDQTLTGTRLTEKMGEDSLALYSGKTQGVELAFTKLSLGIYETFSSFSSDFSPSPHIFITLSESFRIYFQVLI